MELSRILKCYANDVFYKMLISTKLKMKHLGGFGFDKRLFELSVVPGSNPWDIHLWMATQEQRDQSFLQVKMLPVQPLVIWALF